MTPEGTVRAWDVEEGWGVIDSPQTPGGCWFHFSVLRPGTGIGLTRGQRVRFVFENADQDGYRFRAVQVSVLV